MKVYTLRFNKRYAVFALIIIAIILTALVFTIGNTSDGSNKIDTNEDRLAFIESLGYEVSNEPVSEKKVIIPTEFSKTYSDYNDLQIAQGYDLSKYKGVEVTIFTYKVKNYTDYNGEVLLELYINDGEVIGGDIHSAALDGFIHGLK